jgi:hypothetical protein
MKKRKPPIVLVTVLGVMLAAVVIMNAPNASAGGHNHDHHDLANQAQPETSAARPTDSKESVAAKIQGAAGGESTMEPVGGGPESPDGAQPTIANRRQSISKPEPNDSSTSTQWWK